MLLALVRHTLRPSEGTATAMLRQVSVDGEVARIDVPTSLIWGRQDRVPLAAAREASVRYGWPLDVIDDAGHFLGADQPEAFLQALRRALDRL